jgi:hypothetical protein
VKLREEQDLAKQEEERKILEDLAKNAKNVANEQPIEQATQNHEVQLPVQPRIPMEVSPQMKPPSLQDPKVPSLYQPFNNDMVLNHQPLVRNVDLNGDSIGDLL